MKILWQRIKTATIFVPRILTIYDFSVPTPSDIILN